MRSCIKPQAIFSQLMYFLFVSDICRQIEFDHSFDGKRLKNHVIRTAEVQSERLCATWNQTASVTTLTKSQGNVS